MIVELVAEREDGGCDLMIHGMGKDMTSYLINKGLNAALLEMLDKEEVECETSAMGSL